MTEQENEVQCRIRAQAERADREHNAWVAELLRAWMAKVYGINGSAEAEREE